MSDHTARISCLPWMTTRRSRNKPSLPDGHAKSLEAAPAASAAPPSAPVPNATPAGQTSATMAIAARAPKTSAQASPAAPSVTIDRRDLT